MDYMELTKSRFSCRKFKDTPVEDDKIAKIVQVFLNAPSAVNRQPVRLWVVRSPEKLALLKECTPYTFDAPAILMVAYSESEAWTRKYDTKNLGDIDATIAATQAMYEIQDLGLGSTWVAAFDPAVVKAKFPETEGFTVTALFPFGYPADDVEPAPMHFQRRSEAEIVRYI